MNVFLVRTTTALLILLCNIHQIEGLTKCKHRFRYNIEVRISAANTQDLLCPFSDMTDMTKHIKDKIQNVFDDEKIIDSSKNMFLTTPPTKNDNGGFTPIIWGLGDCKTRSCPAEAGRDGRRRVLFSRTWEWVKKTMESKLSNECSNRLEHVYKNGKSGHCLYGKKAVVKVRLTRF